MTIQSIDLLGDSILDNASYVERGDAVIEQIRKFSPIHVSLLAVDGDTTLETLQILADLGDDPKPGTGAVLSVGGNDALQKSSILMESCTSVLEAFSKMQPILDAFRGRYIAVLEKLLQIYDREHIRVCTVYNRIPLGPTMPREALTALGLFNEIILEETNRRKLQVLDLRVICELEDSYSTISPIEPSKEGGQRIVAHILKSYGLSSE